MTDTSASGNGFGSRPGDINKRGRGASPVAGIRVLVHKALRRKAPDGRARVERLLDKLVELGEAGDVQAIKLLLQYGYGRPGLCEEMSLGVVAGVSPIIYQGVTPPASNGSPDISVADLVSRAVSLHPH